MLEDAAKLPEAAREFNELWMVELKEAEQRYTLNDRKPGDILCSWVDARDGSKHHGLFQPERLRAFGRTDVA